MSDTKNLGILESGEVEGSGEPDCPGLPHRHSHTVTEYDILVTSALISLLFALFIVATDSSFSLLPRRSS